MNGYMSIYTSPKFIINKVDKPIFYKKPFLKSAAFYTLAIVTTMIIAGGFYYA